MNVKEMAKRAKEVSYKLTDISTEIKNRTLKKAAELLRERKELIEKENQKDLIAGEEKGLSKAMLDRLLLNEKRINGMIQVLNDVASLNDPVGEIIKMWKRPNGIKIGKMRVPLGVVGIIYESRPNVTVEAASLCIKSSNAVILKGGSEAINSNRILVNILKEAATSEGFPEEAIQFIDTTERLAVKEMLQLDEYIDVIIPRGGEGLIRFVAENARMPVIKHYKGVCHVFVDEFADLEKAWNICFNAKVQRPGVCNAMETMLVHSNISDAFMPTMIEMFKKAKVELRGCERALQYDPKYIKPATEDDWYAEYLDLILAVKIVDSLDEAIDHINTYGSHHSDAIVTENYTNGMKFLNRVDSAAVYINASTRFTDGNVFGLGAEMGISTDKIHVRGPMGLEDLTIPKYIIFGDGQIRE
ncbi:Gamma-glutamyl phosphate reductase [Desulfurobacterium thermolithotrophum DSM 11699]|uniref:Gamma-glutamyl phosphate reductase n=1 Tax=Desulfurobacterium thermolithotrophum (strain DSM 11699 / BSA) TaxID=868864 RepID=F0S015_DESTD|nr:glutamate-5-semialdehyde dehydrogenase [Desulfurobacterium thermolithotrophum]ADY73696.1 Gamma-glutamyl phosphate reductase [Desulfurobacterium thermolithotrophum DSM 11699]